MSPRKGSNRIKGNARRTQAETGRSYTASLRESTPALSPGQGVSPSPFAEYLRLARRGMPLSDQEIIDAVTGMNPANISGNGDGLVTYQDAGLTMHRSRQSSVTESSTGSLSHVLDIIRVKRTAPGVAVHLSAPDFQIAAYLQFMQVIANRPATSGFLNPAYEEDPDIFWMTRYSIEQEMNGVKLEGGQVTIKTGLGTRELTESPILGSAIIDGIITADEWIRAGSPTVPDDGLDFPEVSRYEGLSIHEDEWGGSFMCQGHVDPERFVRAVHAYLEDLGVDEDGRDLDPKKVSHGRMAPQGLGDDEQFIWVRRGEYHPAAVPMTHI